MTDAYETCPDHLHPLLVDALRQVTRASRPVAGRVARRLREQHPDMTRQQLVLRGAELYRGKLGAVSALPYATGVLADRLGVHLVVAAVQALVVVTAAEVHGETDDDEVVRVAGGLVFDYALDPERVPDKAGSSLGTIRRREDGEEAEPLRRTVVRVVRILRAIPELAERRANGRLWHRGLSKLPAVGVVGGFLGERHALSDLAAAAAEAFESTPRAGDAAGAS